MFMPIVGIFLIEYWVLAHGSVKFYQPRVGWHLNGFIALILGFASTRLPFGVSFVNGMVVAAIVYLVLESILRRKQVN